MAFLPQNILNIFVYYTFLFFHIKLNWYISYTRKITNYIREHVVMLYELRMRGQRKRKSRKKYIKLNRHHFPYVVKPLHLPLCSPSLPIIMIIMSIIITIGRLSPSPHILSASYLPFCHFHKKKLYSQLLYSQCYLPCWMENERMRVKRNICIQAYFIKIILNFGQFSMGSLCLMIYWDMNKYKSSQIFLMWFNRNDL